MKLTSSACLNVPLSPSPTYVSFSVLTPSFSHKIHAQTISSLHCRFGRRHPTKKKRKEKSMDRHHGAVATLLSPLLTRLPSRYEFIIKSLHEFDRDVSLVALCSYHIIFYVDELDDDGKEEEFFCSFFHLIIWKEKINT
jgi:hypothetical protein